MNVKAVSARGAMKNADSTCGTACASLLDQLHSSTLQNGRTPGAYMPLFREFFCRRSRLHISFFCGLLGVAGFGPGKGIAVGIRVEDTCSPSPQNLVPASKTLLHAGLPIGSPVFRGSHTLRRLDMSSFAVSGIHLKATASLRTDLKATVSSTFTVLRTLNSKPPRRGCFNGAKEGVENFRKYCRALLAKMLSRCASPVDMPEDLLLLTGPIVGYPHQSQVPSAKSPGAEASTVSLLPARQSKLVSTRQRLLLEQFLGSSNKKDNNFRSFASALQDQSFLTSLHGSIISWQCWTPPGASRSFRHAM